jgi:hypothetical protein
MRKLLLLFMGLLLISSFPVTSHAQQLQTVYAQSLGPVGNTTGCTASTGVVTSATITPCGGQGSMYQNSLVTSHTVSWTVVGTVGTCTVQLEQATTLTGTYTALGTAQTCTSSGTYTATLSAAYVRLNITALTTTGTGSVTVNYYGQIGNAPQNIVSSAMTCGTVVGCVPAFQTNWRTVTGSAAATAGVVTVTGIAPAFTSATTMWCSANDGTTALNNVFKIANTAGGAGFTLTSSVSSTDVYNWFCMGY